MAAMNEHATQRTACSPTESEAIMARIGETRARGYADIDQEIEIGLRSLVVTLTDARAA